MKQNSNIKFVFFGTSEFSVSILNTLKKKGLVPSLAVTTEDRPRGRGLKLSPTPVKIWAEVHGVPVYQPENLREESVESRLKQEKADVFIVVAYGKMIPKNIFELPPYKTLNVHPSLLPKLRGPSPIESTILSGQKPGLTIMLIEEKMDAGPILSQEEIMVAEDPIKKEVLEELLAKRGGELLAETMEKWISGSLKSVPQKDDDATYTRKIDKNDGLIDLNGDPVENLRKVRAFSGRPGAYLFFTDKNNKRIRVIVKEADIIEGSFAPMRVVPEGKKEMDWADFLRGHSAL